MIKIGEPAPEFTLPSTDDKDISLSELRGKWVVLFFYPLDFTPVWSTEVPEFNRRLKEFEKLNAVVLGVNTDSIPTHKAWIESLGGIDYPLLADYDKRVTKDYGVFYDQGGGIALRGTFLIDPDGNLQQYSINNTDVGRSIDEVVRLVKALQMGGACPVNWEEGQDTL